MPVQPRQEDKQSQPRARGPNDAKDTSQIGSVKSMSDDALVLIVEKEPPLAWFKLNRPKVLNSLNREILRALPVVGHHLCLLKNLNR